ncbi:hypothetical protein HK105_205696 [Polyrhizophydium stewartii]|uniref:Prefoldin subunit 3 n=1 Tax=Polyrhizophydium stewartii TaxID=2732419 RepID=A0ABR4N5N8_9FUNG|nr:hypothetical protein HK105_001841 [Polyrhizophydium stewartii]
MMEVEGNPRGIPAAPFVDDVAKFVPDGDYEGTLRKFQEMISKYRFMETHLLQRKAGLESKAPEIKKTLEMVLFLKSKEDSDEPIATEFELSDTLWARASIPPTKTVNLWLGANVMLEYTLDEASELLSTKLKSALTTLEQVNEDLEFLKEQITTVEVNMARVYNDDVRRRRLEKDAGGSSA